MSGKPFKPGSKVCEKCGEIYFAKRSPSGVTEGPSHFAKRRYCSRACSGTARSLFNTAKPCRHCGRSFTRFLADGTTIPPADFNRHLYCSRDCRIASHSARWAVVMGREVLGDLSRDEERAVTLLRRMDDTTRAAAIEQLQWIVEQSDASKDESAAA